MLGETFKFTPSEHYARRAVTRALRPEVEAFILDWGVITRATGANHVTLVRRALPPKLRASKLAERAEGWILVVSTDGTLVTCYRRRKAWRFVRIKSELKHPVPTPA